MEANRSDVKYVKNVRIQKTSPGVDTLRGSSAGGRLNGPPVFMAVKPAGPLDPGNASKDHLLSVQTRLRDPCTSTVRFGLLPVVPRNARPPSASYGLIAGL